MSPDYKPDGLLLAKTVKLLLGMMEGRFRNFPNDYMVIDTETTGVVSGTDLITQLGCVLVLDGEPSETSTVLNWTRHPAINQQWLRERLLATKQQVEQDRDGRPTGKTYHTTYESLQQGEDPATALREYCELIERARTDGLFVVAHNGTFDLRFLQHHFDRFVGAKFDLGDYDMFDTGVCVKAAQASMAPWKEDTPRSFAARVASARLKGVFWSLDGFCMKHFGLVEKHGLDTAKAHTAGFDCTVTHLLFQSLLEAARRIP